MINKSKAIHDQKILKGILHTEEEDKYHQENMGKNKSH
jgi:hypothetical protein